MNLRFLTGHGISRIIPPSQHHKYLPRQQPHRKYLVERRVEPRHLRESRKMRQVRGRRTERQRPTQECARGEYEGAGGVRDTTLEKSR